MTRHPRILPTVGAQEWGEEMHVQSLSQEINVNLAQPELEPETW